jgi:branched-chain amino acid transport system substrate-binding protein
MVQQHERMIAACFAAILLMTAATTARAQAPSGEPIKIGYGIAQTGGLAANGRSALLAQKIWEEDVNAKGGLLGRPVKLIHYDDQSNPANVPAIYEKLLDVDKVDTIIGGYGTSPLAAAMPVAIQKQKTLIGLFGLAVNSAFSYPRYFSMIPLGPTPKSAQTKGFFDIAIAQNPKPQTLAIVAADSEFSINGSDGARENAKAAGLKVVYDKRYPPATTDFAPVVRSIQAANPDIVIIFSYPPDSVGMVRAVNEVGYKPKMIGGGMVGLQAAAIKTQLGPLLNGFVDFDYWMPTEKMSFDGVSEFISKYQSRAQQEGVDALGYHIAPWAYAQLQVLQQAVAATKSLDDDKLADYMRKSTFKTLIGDVKFGPGGEWAESRVLQLQFQHIKGNDIGQFKNLSTQIVLMPAQYKSGDMIYPYAMAK